MSHMIRTAYEVLLFLRSYYYHYYVFFGERSKYLFLHKCDCAINILSLQQAFPRLIEGLPAVTGATTMFINPYTYAAAGGLATMMPSDTSYQQFQQVQPQIATAAAYSNLIPAQMQAVYMQQPTQYQYATSPAAVQSQPVQYARCYQVSFFVLIGH